MKFVLAATPRYWWPVKVRIPDPENPGQLLEQTLKIQFEPQDRDEAVAQQEIYEKLATQKARASHEHEQLTAICKNWDDVIGEDNAPVPFTVENFGAALQQAWFRTAVYRAYAESLSGEAARLGN